MTFHFVADRKTADPLRLAVHSALDSFLLSELSAMVVDYGRSRFVDWDCETCLDSQLIRSRLPKNARAPTGPVWTTEHTLSDPPLTVELPPTGRFVWLCGRQPFGAPLTVRRWSMAVVSRTDNELYFGVTSRDSKAAAAEEGLNDLKGLVCVKCPSGVVCDGREPNSDEEEPPPRLRIVEQDGFVLTMEVDVERRTLTLQTVEPPSAVVRTDQIVGGGLALARSGLPAEWTASSVLTVDVPDKLDLSHSVPVCGLSAERRD